MTCSLLTPIPLFAGEVAFGLRPLQHPLAVQSSLLASVAYDQERAILPLEFGFGAVYQDFGVPVQRYPELLLASSHGIHFNRPIRSVFRYALVPPA